MPAFREAIPQEISVLANALLLVPQDPQVLGGTGAPVIIVAWSMQYELVFYILFGIFIFNARVGAASLSFVIAWWLISALSSTVPAFPFGFMQPHFFAIFALGVVAALILRARPVPRPMLFIIAGALLYVSEPECARRAADR
jgi:exopolysaccharide production protein ExoZ